MRSLPVKLVRFVGVGVLNGAIYAASTSLLTSGFGIEGKLASVFGYATSIPFAFYAHRSYTFGSKGKVKSEFRRFLISQGTGLIVSVFLMAAAIDYLGLHYAFGIVAAIVVVPSVNFLVLDQWVFFSGKAVDHD